MNQDQKRMFTAVFLSAIVLFAWQAFFAPKNQNVVAKKAETKVETSQSATPAPAPLGSESEKEPTVNLISKKLSNDLGSITFDSSLKVTDLSSKAALYSFSETIGEGAYFQVYLNKASKLIPLNFNFTNVSESSLEGRDEVNRITLRASKSSENSFTSFQLLSDSPEKFVFIFSSSERELESRLKREFLITGTEAERFRVGEVEKGELETRWAGVDFNYHLLAATFGAKHALSYQTTSRGLMSLHFSKALNSLDFKVIFTEKNYDKLKSFDEALDLSVDYGMFSILAVPILRGLQFFYNYIGNWGVAIILLTFLIRLMVFPLAFKSYKSMKKMQTIQPKIAALKEKYKDDPAKMQRESMALFKREGASPLGGCLPMLLQMPIFFAFFRVLSSSVELVNAPFAGWLTDLSAKDPYYVLPILLGVVMVAQQKLMPTTTVDKTQKRMMMILPLVFCFIMKDFPAGLNLYSLTSILFGVIQQKLVYRTIK